MPIDRENDFIKTDEEKKERIKDAGDRKENKEACAVVVFDHTWGDVEENGLGNLYNNRMVKILTEKGIAEFSVLRFDYDPNSYITNVLKLRIHRKTGEIEELDAGGYRDVLQPEHLLYWRVRMKLFNVPDLQTGDAVEWVTFRKGFNIAYLKESRGETGRRDGDSGKPRRWVDPETGISPPMYGAFFDIVHFQEKIPIKEKRYTLLSPLKMPLVYEFYRGECRSSVTMDGEYHTYSWEKKDIGAYKPEPKMWGPNGSLPKLLVSTIPNWKSKSKWFYEANKDNFEWDEEIKAKVDEITAPWKTDDEKAAALLHWVAQEIRYVGFSISKGEGYTLHPGTMTFRERGGVCKDTAGMLVTMLRAAGYESYPAQTQALVPVHRIPADQFDHCVTAWKKPDGTWKMLDPTWAIYSMDTWDTGEGLQNYLIGTPEGEESLGQTRLFKPEESLMEIRVETELSGEGNLRGQMRIDGSGRSDSTMRFKRVFRPTIQEPVLYRFYLASIDPEIEMTGLNLGDVDDLTTNYFLETTFKVRNYAVPEGNTLYLNVPAARFLTNPFISRYLEEAEADERKFDIMMLFLQEIVAKETLTLPAGYRLASSPAAFALDKEPASFSFEIKGEPGKLLFDARLILKSRSVSTKKFKDFKEVMTSVKDLSKRVITLEKENV